MICQRCRRGFINLIKSNVRNMISLKNEPKFNKMFKVDQYLGTSKYTLAIDGTYD